MVPEAEALVHTTTTANSKPKKELQIHGAVSRTHVQSEVEDIRLASEWQTRLSTKGWSERASSQVKFTWIHSTLIHYDHMCNKLVKFCKLNGYDFPPRKCSVIADFLCSISDSSTKPRSALNIVNANIGNLYNALGVANLCSTKEICLLTQGLIKAGTKAPMKFSRAMPVKSFHDLFLTWPDSHFFSLSDLRLKCITLLALTAILRPSAISSRAKSYDPCIGVSTNVVFSLENLNFDQDGVSIIFFGIKNDTQRIGFDSFEVYIPRNQTGPSRGFRINYTEPARPVGGGARFFCPYHLHLNLSMLTLFLIF